MDLTWTPWTIPSGVAIQAISGRPGELYAVSFDDQILRATGTVFSRIIGVSLPQVRDVVVTSSGRVVAISAGPAALLCPSACDVGANYLTRTIPVTGDRFLKLCGRDEEVYALASNTASGALVYRLVGTQWVAQPNAPVGNAFDCVVQPDGSLLVVGTNGIARGTTVETITPLPQTDTPTWRALAVGQLDGGLGDALIVGTSQAGGRSALRPPGSSTWTQQPPELFVLTGLQVAAFGASEFVARVEPRPGFPELLTFQNGTWSPLTGAPSISTLQLITSANGALFLGGFASGQSVLYRGTRP